MTHDFVSIDPSKSSVQEIHKVLLSGVSPRPIALVSTISENGINNLAPYSFFNAFGTNPPTVAFSPSYSGKDGSAKDTLNNLREVPECVIQAVNHSMVEQVSLASTAYGPEIDEFQKSGFTPIDSLKVKPKRVQESPFQMECKIQEIIELGGKNASGNLVICEVVEFHVWESILENGAMKPNALDLVGRNGGAFYTRASGDAIFEVAKPNGIGIGIDLLPDFIRHSHVLSANNLAQLGGLQKLSDRAETEAFIEEILNDARQTDLPEMVRSALVQSNSDSEKAVELLEKAARLALEKNELDFAIKTLMSIELVREK